MVAGSFGRGWLALIEWDGDQKARAQVFHQATNLPVAGDSDYHLDPQATFAPSWMHELKDYPRDGESRIMVGRDRFELPLEIDPRTLEVSVPALELPKVNGQWTLYSLGDGELLASSSHQLARVAAAGKTFADGQHVRVLASTRMPQQGVIVQGHYAHYVGLSWWRMDLRTKEDPELIDEVQYRGRGKPSLFGTFARLGLVWYYEFGQEDILCQVLIDAPKRAPGPRPLPAPEPGSDPLQIKRFEPAR